MRGRFIVVALVLLTVTAAGLSLVDRAQATDTCTTTILLSSTTTVATASGEEQVAVKGSDKKGKYWFKKTCKSCHGKDGDGGEVTPISKTIKQWERFFKKGKHHDDEKLEGTFDETQLLHIKTFLINHAADSDQPETCG